MNSYPNIIYGALLILLSWLPRSVAQNSNSEVSTQVKIQTPTGFKLRPIDFEAVLKLAKANNLTIAELKAKHDLALAEEMKSSQMFFPIFSTSLSLMRHSGIAQNTNGSFLDVNKKNAWTGVNFSGNWHLGEVTYNYLAAKQKTKSAEFAYEAGRNKQILKAVHTFYDLTAAQIKLQTLGQMLSKMEDITNQLEIMVEQGIRYKSDLLLAKVGLNHTKIAMEKANVEFVQQSTKLMGLLNIQDSTLLISLDSILVPIQLIDTLTLPKMDSAYMKRPEMNQAEYNLKTLKTKRKSVTIGLLIPDLKVTLSEGSFGPAFDSLAKQSVFSGSLQWNIPIEELLSGGLRKEYDAMTQMENIHRIEMKNNIHDEILNAYVSQAAAKRQINAAKEAVTLAEEALAGSIQRQKLGTALPLEVFSAQEKLIQSKLDYIEAVLLYNKSQYELYVALGNGW